MEKITFELNEEQKEKLDAFCNKTGISVDSMVRVLVYDVLEKGRMPFIIQSEDSAQKDNELSGKELISKSDPIKLINILQREPDFVGFAVLDSLPEYKAALILQNLPKKKQSQIVDLLLEGNMSNVLANILIDYVAQKAQKMDSEDFLQIGGVDKLTDILNLVDRDSEKEILERIEQKNPEMHKAITERMFVFDDIALLDDRSVQKILREIDQQELAKALKICDPEAANKVFGNMSKRASEMLKEDMEFMGPVRKKDVYEAQEKIVSIIRRLEDCGEIIIARSKDDELVNTTYPRDEGVNLV